MHDHLLTDQEMLRFITHGYHLIHLKDIPDVHDAVCRQTVEAFKGGDPSDGVWTDVPALRSVFDHPVTRGALKSLVGPDYLMYSHRHCHLSPSGFAGGKTHQDGTERTFAGWHRPWRRHFRARTVMAIYYPQRVAIENGPTAVTPGSQYLGALTHAQMAKEIPVCGKAGTIALVHFDIWHRATANQSDRDRIMMKFLFKRTAEPQAPTWSAELDYKPQFQSSDQVPHLPLVWEDMWHWHNDTPWSVPDYSMDLSDLTQNLYREMDSTDEAAAVTAAYTLGCLGPGILPELMNRLEATGGGIRERVPVALSAGGKASVGVLIEALSSSDPWIRTSAADTLGDIGTASLPALPAMRNSLNDLDPWVRHGAVEAIGIWGPEASDARHDVVALLADPEPFVRLNALTALHNMDRRSLGTVNGIDDLLRDPHAKVRHHAHELLNAA